jgi:hypothetical protein
VIVKRLLPDGPRFVDDTPENTARYTEMVLSGALDDFLLHYNHASFNDWHALTNHLKRAGFPPALHPGSHQSAAGTSEQAEKTWHTRQFERNFFELHDGDVTSFLAEFQFAFLRWFVNPNDRTAAARWGYLLQTTYHAGVPGIQAANRLFPPLVDAMLAQFRYLESEMFAPNTTIGHDADRLVQDLQACDSEVLAEKGRALGGVFVEKRPE